MTPTTISGILFPSNGQNMPVPAGTPKTPASANKLVSRALKPNHLRVRARQKSILELSGLHERVGLQGSPRQHLFVHQVLCEAAVLAHECQTHQLLQL